MTITLSQQIELAAEYRKANANDASVDYTQGYIVITGDEVQGWGRAPRPESWVPGTVAIDPDGKAMIATGGNAYDGADNWEPIAQASQEQAEENTVCCLCGDDYGDLAQECFVANTCPDCLDSADSLEDLLGKALPPNTN